MPIALLAALSPLSHGFMYDVVSTTMAPPTSCAHGCAAWSTFPDALLSTVWRNISVAKTAGERNCAQPGLAVDSHILGAWCFCAANEAGDAPVAPPRPISADPDHPFDGQIVSMLVTGTYKADTDFDKYISFAYTDGPPGATGSEAWLRADYSNVADAMPVQFHAVASKPHTYTLFNTWNQTAGYEKWLVTQTAAEAAADVSSSSESAYNFVHAWGTTQAGALEVTIAPQGERSGEFTMQNAADKTYVSYCDGGCSGGLWITSGYTDLNDAMTVKLIPYVPLPPADYCVYADGIPEQINLQLAGPDSVTISFVTFDATVPVGKAQAMFGTTAGSGTSGGTVVTGGTQKYETSAKDRTYYFHFITLTGLKPRMRYYYTVGIGASSKDRSTEFSFRAPHSHADPGPTTLDVYGGGCAMLSRVGVACRHRAAATISLTFVCFLLFCDLPPACSLTLSPHLPPP